MNDAQRWEFKQNETNTSYILNDLKCFDFLLLRDYRDKLLKLLLSLYITFWNILSPKKRNRDLEFFLFMQVDIPKF